MAEAFEDEDLNPEMIFKNLMGRLRKSKLWIIICVVDESFVIGIGELPFKVQIKNGYYFCQVLADTKINAMKMVADNLPVIAFLNYEEK